MRFLSDFALSSSGGLGHGQGKQGGSRDGKHSPGRASSRVSSRGRGVWRSEEEEASALEGMVRSYQHASFSSANPLLAGREGGLEMGPVGGARDSIPSASAALPPPLPRSSARDDPELTGRDSLGRGPADSPGVPRISIMQMAGAMQGGGGPRGSGAGLGAGAVVSALSLARHAQQHAAQVHEGHQHQQQLHHHQEVQQQEQQQSQQCSSTIHQEEQQQEQDEEQQEQQGELKSEEEQQERKL